MFLQAQIPAPQREAGEGDGARLLCLASGEEWGGRGSNSNKHVTFLKGRHLRKGESKEEDPQLTWTRLGDKGNTEAMGVRVTSGEV